MASAHPLVDKFAEIHTALRNGLTAYEFAVFRAKNVSAVEATKLSKWFELYWSMLELHHKSEDTYFYAIFAGYDPEFRPKMEKLTIQHHEIDDYVEKIRSVFSRITDQTANTENEALFREIRQLISDFNQHLDDHLGKEEAIIYPLIRTYIAPKEQLTIDLKYSKSLPLKSVTLFVPWVVANLSGREAQELLKEVPFIMRLLYRLSWKKKYETLVATFQV
jgi:iron-sulfur cluster repair protein YtfE (RIC family)